MEAENIIEENKELKAELENARGEVDKLKAENNTILEEFEGTLKENDALKAGAPVIQELSEDEEVEDFADEVEQIDADLSVAEEDSEEDSEEEEEEEAVGEVPEEEEEEDSEATELEEQENLAKQTAKQILHTLGAEPIAVASEESQLTSEGAIEQFSQLTDPIAKSKFYAKHRELIFNN